MGRGLPFQGRAWSPGPWPVGGMDGVESPPLPETPTRPARPTHFGRLARDLAGGSSTHEQLPSAIYATCCAILEEGLVVFEDL